MESTLDTALCLSWVPICAVEPLAAMTLMCLLDWGTHSSKAIRLARPQSPPPPAPAPSRFSGGAARPVSAPAVAVAVRCCPPRGGSVAFARRGPSLPTV
jgi:hypothetical protein